MTRSMSLSVWLALTLVGCATRHPPIVESRSAALLQSCTPISAAGEQRAPSVSGGRIVWINAADGVEQVLVYDVATALAKPLYLQDSGRRDFDASIDGGSVVWTSQSPIDSGSILFYDLIQTYLLPVASATGNLHFAHPAVGGEYIVWERVEDQQLDIDFYSIKLGGPPGPQVTNDPAAQRYPRVSGDFVVYEDYNSDPNLPAVYGYRLSTFGPPFLIAAKPARTPAIDGDTVVYVGQDVAAMDQIFAYSLQTNVQTQLTTFSSHKYNPRVSGSHVVWSDDRSGDLDVWHHDLSTGEEVAIASGQGDQSKPDVQGDTVVFNTNTLGRTQVAAYTFGADRCVYGAPVSRCRDVTVKQDASGQASANINSGSYDPDGDPVSCTQAPPSPYGLGATNVTLTCSDKVGLSSSCSGTVRVVECYAGTTQCSGDQLQTCDENGRWQPGKTCALGCQNGQCRCATGTTKCVSNAVYACEYGSWRRIVICPSGCIDGQCVPRPSDSVSSTQ